MLLGLNIKLPNRKSGGGYVPVPSNKFIVKNSAGTEYTVTLAVRNSSGVDYAVPVTVKTSGGVEYYIPSDESLYLDYTIPSDGTPGVVPGFYQVDNVSGVLTQTTFSSLITFSRSSNATRYSPTGQLEYAPHNLLLQSQDFSTTWSNGNTTETTNTAVAPDGTTTADTLDDGTSTATHDIAQNVSITSGTTYTLSAFFKNIDRQYVILACSTGTNSWASAKFDLVAGAVGATSSSGAGWSTTSSSITNVGNSWYRCTITFVPGNTASGANRIGMATDSTTFTAGLRGLESYTGTNKQIYIWGAQLAVGPNALDYTPTTTAVVYGPRFDYDPTTLAAKGLLIEEQRTNSIRNNTMVGAVAGTPGTLPTNWTAVGTFTGLTQQIVGVGTENGITYLEIKVSGTPVSSASWDIRSETTTQVVAANGQTWTKSVYIKLVAGSLTNITLENIVLGRDSGGAFISGQIGSSAIVPTNSVLSTQRTSVSFTFSSASVAYVLPAIRFNFTSGAAVDITLRIGLPQLEQGAFATSVIPTTTAATTRSADIASIGTLSPWYNATEGTLFTEGTVVNNIIGTTARVFGYFVDSGATNIFVVEARSATSTRARITIGGANVNASDTINVLGVNAKLAGAYGSDGATICVNGRSPVTAASSLPTGIAALYLGQNSVPTAASIANGYLRRVTYTPRRLTDVELQSLTS